MTLARGRISNLFDYFIGEDNNTSINDISDRASISSVPDQSIGQEMGDPLSEYSLYGRHKDLGWYESQTKRICIFLVSALLVGSAGTIFSFNAFASDLKENFEFAQTEVNFIFAIGFFGINFAPLPSAVCERVGPKLVALVGLILSTAGYLLIWATMNRYIAVSFYWVAVYYALVGQGSVWTYKASLLSAIHCFIPQKTGTIVGLLDVVYGLSAVVFSGIYKLHFDSENSLENFFLFLAITTAGANFLGILVLRISARKEHYLPVSTGRRGSKITSPNSQQKRESSQTVVWSDVNFWLLLLIVSIGSGVGFMYMANIGFILESTQNLQHLGLHSVIIPLSYVVGRLLLTLVSSAASERHVILLFLASTLALSAQLLLILVLDGNTFVILLCTSVLTGLYLGLLWSISPLWLTKLITISRNHFSWVYVMFVSSLFVVVFQVLSGEVYRRHGIHNKDNLMQKDCDGIHCYQVTFIICAIATAIQLPLSIALMREQRKQSNERIISQMKNDMFTY